MIYCTFEVLKNMANNEEQGYMFITNNKQYEDTIKIEVTQGEANSCFKDGVGSIENAVDIICDYGKYAFGFTRFTVDVDMDVDIPEVTFLKQSLQKSLKQGNAIICMPYEVENIETRTLYILDCVKENKTNHKRFNLDENIYTDINLTKEEIEDNLKKQTFAIIPLRKRDEKLVFNSINIGLNENYIFYENLCPELFYSIDKVLEKYIEIPADFINYRYCVVKINNIIDKHENKIVQINLLKELDIYEMMDLDNTGKTHLSMVSNYKDLDIVKITESLKNVCSRNKNVDIKNLYNYVKKSKIKDIGWIEDYIINSKDFYDVDVLLKFLKTCKKIIKFDKLYNFIIEHGDTKQVVSGIKENKTIELTEVEVIGIKRFGKDRYDLAKFACAFPENKFNKIKDVLIDLSLKSDSCYTLEAFFKFENFDKISLLEELITKAKDKGSEDFLTSAVYVTQKLISKDIFEQDFVDKVMNFLFEIDKTGEKCYRIREDYLDGFGKYKSDIEKFRDRIKDKVNLYRKNSYR